MVPLTSLWIPILLAAVLVFLASSVLHMVLTYHRTDYDKLPQEDRVMEAMRPFKIPPGDYLVPHATSPKAMNSPEFRQKRDSGPVALMTVLENGPVAMGGPLAQWFIYCVVVSLFAGYVASRALGVGAEYLDVSQIAGTTAFIGYSLALWQNTIWFKRKWTTTLKANLDGLLYGFLTGGVFGWLWP